MQSTKANLKLYHGTSERHLESILKNGILPRNETNVSGNWDHTIPSSDDRVYLTKGYAPYFAFSSAESGERWLIIEVDKNRMVEMDTAVTALVEKPKDSPAFQRHSWEKFFPDEDFVENLLRDKDFETILEQNPKLAYDLQNGGYPWAGTVLKRTAWLRDNIGVVENFAEASLNSLGNISWRGRIPPAAITRVSLYDPKSNPAMTMAACDPTISTLNWRICAGKYEEITRWFLGYDVSAARICTLNDSRASEAELIIRRKQYDWLMTIRAEIEGLDPELYVRMDYSPDGKTEYAYEDAAVHINNKHSARIAKSEIDTLLDGSHTVKEILETIERRTSVLSIQYEQQKAWEEEVLPERSGIEVVEMAQMGVGSKIQMFNREQVTNSLIEETLTNSQIEDLIRNGGPEIERYVSIHGIEAVTKLIKGSLAEDIRGMWNTRAP